MNTIKDVICEVEKIDAIQKTLKKRSMIYQVEEKERIASEKGLPIDSFYNLPYQEWMRIKDTHRDLPEETA